MSIRTVDGSPSSSSSEGSSSWGSIGAEFYSITSGKEFSSRSRSALGSYSFTLIVVAYRFFLLSARVSATSGISFPALRSPRISGLKVNSSGSLLHSIASSSLSNLRRQYCSDCLCNFYHVGMSACEAFAVPGRGGFLLLILGLKVSSGSPSCSKSLSLDISNFLCW